MSIIPKMILAAIAATAVLGIMPQASAVTIITYNINVTVGDATATGFFTGIEGHSSADIGAPFNLLLTEGSSSERLVANSTSPFGNGQVSAGNSDAVTATATNVYFNFSDPNQDYLKFYVSSMGFPGDTMLCFQTFAFCGGTGAGIVIEVKGASDPFEAMTGNQIIASTTRAIPELSTWTMLLAAFGGLGLAGYRRKRAAA